MILKNKKNIKGMIFAGCSFTWGQGLNYYNDFPTNVNQPLGKYDKLDLSACQIKFIEKHRFPRLVANHFDSYEFVRINNGGSNKQAINFFQTCFDQCRDIHSAEAKTADGIIPVRIDYKEISYLIFQLTQPERDIIPLVVDNNYYDQYDVLSWLSEGKSILDIYLSNLNISLDFWIEQCRLSSIQNVKNFLLNCEKNGIKTIVTTWPWENIKYIQEDHFLRNRLLPIKYNNNVFYSIDDLMGRNGYNNVPFERSEMIIRFDYDSFITPPSDMHMSKKAHEVVANSIIEYIEQNTEKL